MQFTVTDSGWTNIVLWLNLSAFLTCVIAQAGSTGRLLQTSPMDSQTIIFTNEIDTWMGQPDQNFSNMPYHLQQVLKALNSTETLADPDRAFHSSSPYCTSCKMLSTMVIGYSKMGGPIDMMTNFLIKICYLVVYQSMSVCEGLINQDKPALDFILRRTDIGADEVCALVLGGQGCGYFRRESWMIALPPPDNLVTPASAHSSVSREHKVQDNRIGLTSTSEVKEGTNEGVSEGYSWKDKRHSSSNKSVMKVLHLTDPHYDPHYRVGSNAVCEAPLCCNPDSGKPRKAQDAAGKWGDYRNCDSPKWLLQHMLHHIRTNHPDIDYVISTGDLVPHHIWRISKEDNVEVLNEVTDLMLSYFPNTPIYGAIGNHESFPRDSFPPPEVPDIWSRFGVQWLYDVVSDQWAKLMGEPVPSSARFGAYYSVLIRPGFRIISINSNYCYRLNWWLLYKSVDPGLVLRWLVGELQLAEMKGEFVHIIGHIPPYYSDCYAQWAHQFSRIVTRYSHIIRGQFYGHSHLDEFRVHFDVNSPEKPIGVQYVTPNNGPFHDLNPSYRIFYVDGEHPDTTRNILDYETYVMNLTHANLYDSPHWNLLYSARKDLQLPSLSPKHWNELVWRMARDPQLFAKYYRYQVQNSDGAVAKGCDDKCRKATLCSILEGDRLLPRKCKNRNR